MSENSPRRQDSRHSNPVRDTPTSRRDDGSSTRSAPPNRPSNNNISEDRLRSPGQSTSSSSRNPKPGDTNKSPGGKGRDSNIGSPVRASGQSAGKNASSPSRSLPFRDRGEGSSLGVSGAMGHDRQNRESQESQRSRKERPSNLGRPKLVYPTLPLRNCTDASYLDHLVLSNLHQNQARVLIQYFQRLSYFRIKFHRVLVRAIRLQQQTPQPPLEIACKVPKINTQATKMLALKFVYGPILFRSPFRPRHTSTDIRLKSILC